MRAHPNISLSSIEYLVIAGLLFSQSIIWALDKTVNVNLTVDSGANYWLIQPWVWITAAVFFIIILVTLLKSKK